MIMSASGEKLSGCEIHRKWGYGVLGLNSYIGQFSDGLPQKETKWRSPVSSMRTVNCWGKEPGWIAE